MEETYDDVVAGGDGPEETYDDVMVQGGGIMEELYEELETDLPPRPSRQHRPQCLHLWKRNRKSTQRWGCLVKLIYQWRTMMSFTSM